MALSARESRFRSRLWDRWEARLNRATNALQGALIVLFAALSVLALLGRFVNAPEYVAISWFALLLLGLLGSARPIAKRFFVQGREATQPTTAEFVGTLVLSTAVVGTCAIMWWQGVLYKMERAVMVWTYWLHSLLLMQLTGLFVGFVGLLLLFTGFFCCCCCNCCCRGPWLTTLFGWCRRRRTRAQQLKLASVKDSAANLTSAMVDQTKLARSALTSTGEVDVKGMDEVEPILDFVENKAQVRATCTTRIQTSILRALLTNPSTFAPAHCLAPLREISRRSPS